MDTEKMMQIAIGVNIKSIRKQRGICQERLAEVADISVNHLSNIERGKCSMSALMLIRISKALNVSIDGLVGTEKRGFQERTKQHYSPDALAEIKNLLEIAINIINSNEVNT